MISTQSARCTSAFQLYVACDYLVQIAEARAAGQARKEEAIRRREEFVMKQSEAKLVSSKSVQQLNAEREEMIAREVAKIQVCRFYIAG